MKAHKSTTRKVKQHKDEDEAFIMDTLLTSTNLIYGQDQGTAWRSVSPETVKLRGHSIHTILFSVLGIGVGTKGLSN